MKREMPITAGTQTLEPAKARAKAKTRTVIVTGCSSRRRPLLGVQLGLTLGLLFSCATPKTEPEPPPTKAVTSTTTAMQLRPWPEADVLFRHAPRFRGADSAYSVDLGHDRVLWLFGDTFVGDANGSRTGSSMIRNSIAIQTGYNPTRAEIAFYFGQRNENPAAFFGGEGATWLWPGPATLVGEELLLSFMVVEKSETGLGFKTVGSAAIVVDNPRDEPTLWRSRKVAFPIAGGSGARIGAGAFFIDANWLYAFAPVEPGNHDIYLARLSATPPMRFETPQWVATDGTWTDDARKAAVIVAGLQTEFSVTRLPTGQLAMISVDGFGGTNVVVRTAMRPQGPWSTPRVLHRPMESDEANVLVYSAKAHPEISGDEVVVTYCTNHTDFPTLASRMDLYFPRFLRRE